MKPAGLAAVLALASIVPASADECRDRFARYLESTIDSRRPGKAHIVTEIKGGPTTENEFLFVSQDHHMHKTMKPAGVAWTLTYMGAMYISADEGKTWTKKLDFDRAKRRAETETMLKTQAASARNTVCGEDVIDGRPHDTYEADIGDNKIMPIEAHAKYWVDRKTGETTKTVSVMKGSGIESRSTQNWQPDPSMSLPMPK